MTDIKLPDPTQQMLAFVAAQSDARVDGEEEPLKTYDGYDDCIVGIVVGFGGSAAVAYDRKKVIAKLQAGGMDEEEAEEFFEFNIIGGYIGKTTPMFLLKPEDES